MVAPEEEEAAAALWPSLAVVEGLAALEAAVVDGAAGLGAGLGAGGG